MDDDNSREASIARIRAAKEAEEPVELSQNIEAQEPIEDRLRRAWLNGFCEGVMQGLWVEGNWDRRRH